MGSIPVYVAAFWHSESGLAIACLYKSSSVRFSVIAATAISTILSTRSSVINNTEGLLALGGSEALRGQRFRRFCIMQVWQKVQTV